MKKLLTVLVVFVYVVPVTFFIILFTILTHETSDSSQLIAFVIPVVLMLLVCGLVVVNFLAATISAAKGKYLSFRTVMVSKLCLIPFYIVNFACWMFASMVFHIALFVLPMIPFIIAYTYFTMLGTSAYVICKLFSLRKCGIITTKQFVVHCILQIIFTVDVADSIYLAVKQKKFDSVPDTNSGE